MNIREAILRKVRESADVKQQFFEKNAGQIEALCQAMAQRFRQGKKLFVMGNGGSACDALHVAVEFKHPIIEKRRPLPAEARGASRPQLRRYRSQAGEERIELLAVTVSGRTHLVSPAMAAAAAVTGHFTDVRELL